MSEEQAATTGPSPPGSGSSGRGSPEPASAAGPAGPPSDPPSVQPPVRTPVRRSTHDRYIAGVCGGVGRATGVDPVVYRVVLAVLTLFGGVGVLLYALGWLLLPAEDQDQSEAQKLLSGRGSSSSVLPLVGIAVSAIVVVGFITAGSDVAIVVIVAFVVIAVVVSKQRQDTRTSAAPADHEAAASSPLRAGPIGGEVASVPPPPHDPRLVPPSFTGTQPPGPRLSGAPSMVPAGSGFGSPWSGAYPYLPEAGTQVGPGPSRREHRRSWLGLVTLAVAAMVGGIVVVAGVHSDTDSGVPAVAAVLVVIGVGLLVGTWYGRSRGLIGWGIVSTILLVIIAAFDVPFGGHVGEAQWAPTTVTAAEAEPYRLVAGEATLDLSELTPPPGTTADVEASVTTGRLVVDVPAGLPIEVQAHVGLGHLALLTDASTSRDRGGFNLTASYTDPGDPAPHGPPIPAPGDHGNVAPGDPGAPTSPAEMSAGKIVLDLEVGVGELEVRRAPA